ncbi:MAG: periplasmic heavy metal sensor [Acidobacteriota bacterium]
MKFRALLLLVAAAVFAGAQPRPPFSPWWENPVANGLDLTEAQTKRVQDIAKEFNVKAVQLREAVDKAERDLEAVFNADTVDWQKGRQAIEQLVAVRSELTRDLARMTLRMRAVLSIDQWRTLQIREAMNPGPGRGKGRGRGFRPPPNGSSSAPSDPRP